VPLTRNLAALGFDLSPHAGRGLSQFEARFGGVAGHDLIRVS
jgi:hypothetical protein